MKPPEDADLVKYGLQGRSVVRRAVPLCPLALDADELIHGKALVLRVRPPEDAARAVEQPRGLGRRWDRGLHERRGRARAAVDVALAPALDRRRAAREHDGAADDADRGGHVLEVDVVEDERARERGGRLAVAKEDRGVDHRGIDDGEGSDGLRQWKAYKYWYICTMRDRSSDEPEWLVWCRRW